MRIICLVGTESWEKRLDKKFEKNILITLVPI
jgi:hypothetical protein